MTTAENSCSVCVEALEAHTATRCDTCAALFHLNQRTDMPGKDCGDVWVDDDQLGLRFRCNTCLHPAFPGALDDVLDLDEAAEDCRVDAAALIEAAEHGDIAHRKTRSGNYLFERRALLDFTGRLY